MTADTPNDGPVVLFDGVCNLCSGFVQFLAPRDPEGRFRFASLQSEAGRELLAERGLPTDELESVVLVEGDDHYVKSDAVLRIAELLGGVYGLLAPFRLVPRRIRDRAYDVVAANRYRWFGKKDRCEIPDGDVRERLLE
ncbi:thiol-disulfide oxidoreductase DCC family protein [Halostella sp. JP-L12]|uniref:thiol-disulfide oxidoreductase DCC family protein n=1 Tax=Halostella TaxID=1843185 RepID=UPI000EF801A6|nr:MULTISPECIES: thiol-disulfide oxidoreductase DCC family protein [Halostella]NHN47813.1 thiol-disulfide oxidoreductase DCC family protein [Halostella sp. JP-L12]